MNLNLVFIFPLGFKHHVEPQKLISKKIRKHPPARPLCDDDGGGGGGGADDNGGDDSGCGDEDDEDAYRQVGKSIGHPFPDAPSAWNPLSIMSPLWPHVVCRLPPGLIVQPSYVLAL